jgi:hypothetical protein
MQVLQFETFYGKPNYKQKKINGCNTHIDKLVYAPRGLFMKMGNVIIYK